MPKDYAKSNHNNKQTNIRSALARLLILSIFLTIVGITIWYIMFRNNKESSQTETQKSSVPIVEGTPAKKFAEQALKQANKTTLDKKINFKFDQSNAITSRPSLFILQLASVNTAKKADQLNNHLKTLGYKTVSIIPHHQGNNTLYRLQMGPYKNKAQAQHMQTQLQKQNIYSLITTTS